MGLEPLLVHLKAIFLGLVSVLNLQGIGGLDPLFGVSEENFYLV